LTPGITKGCVCAICAQCDKTFLPVLTALDQQARVFVPDNCLQLNTHLGKLKKLKLRLDYGRKSLPNDKRTSLSTPSKYNYNMKYSHCLETCLLKIFDKGLFTFAFFAKKAYDNSRARARKRFLY
jgi:hypothetical protein